MDNVNRSRSCFFQRKYQHVDPFHATGLFLYTPSKHQKTIFRGYRKMGRKMNSGLKWVNLIFLLLTQSTHLLPGLSHWKIPLVTITQDNLSVHQQSTHMTHVTFGITCFVQSSILAQVPELLRILVIDVAKVWFGRELFIL